MEGECESDEEGFIIKRCTVKKRRLSSSGSDSEIPRRSSKEGITTPQSANVAGSRCSERIKSKKSQIFSMPTRDDVWGKTKSANTRQLSPKKLVNDFTRINNRYNAESIDVFEDSSLSDFIDDTPSEQSTSDSECQKKHRVKNFKKRKSRSRILENDSDSDSEILEKTTNISTVKETADSTYSTGLASTNSEDNGESLQKPSYSDSANAKDIDATSLSPLGTQKCFGENHTTTRFTKCKNYCGDPEESKTPGLEASDSKTCGLKASSDSKSPGLETSSDSKSPGLEASDSKTSGLETSGLQATSDVDSFSDDDNIRVVRKRHLSAVLDSDESSSENISAKRIGHSLRDTQKRTTEKKQLLFKGLKDARARHSKPS